MNYKITPVEKGEKVEFKNPIKDFYDAIGGDEGMQKLMYSFYDKIYDSDIAHFSLKMKMKMNLNKLKLKILNSL